MHILAICKSALQSESNPFCSQKARSGVHNDLHLRQVLGLARTFRRKTFTNSPHSSSTKPTLDISSEYMMSLVSSCSARFVCSVLWIKRMSRRSWNVRGVELQVVCVGGAPAIDLDPRMSLPGHHAPNR